jgi:hypothetical protein
MKTLLSIAVCSCFLLFGFSGCDKNCSSDPSCNEINLNKPFTARLGERWCLESENLEINFGPFVEDSRCNVPGIECIWAGRYVMATTLVHGDAAKQDTFYAVHNWTDTLYSGNLSIILNKVLPETRPTTDPIDQSNYAFDVVVKKE